METNLLGISFTTTNRIRQSIAEHFKEPGKQRQSWITSAEYVLQENDPQCYIALLLPVEYADSHQGQAAQAVVMKGTKLVHDPLGDAQRKKGLPIYEGDKLTIYYAVSKTHFVEVDRIDYQEVKRLAKGVQGATSISATSLRASIGQVGKTDLNILLEYIVENLAKDNPVTQEDLERDLYHKPVTRFGGFDVRIENPAGTYRSGVDGQGTPWKNLMYNSYGEFLSSMAVDGDRVDVFLGPNEGCKEVFVVHQAQKDNWDKYDEDKVMLGFDTMQDALSAYLRHYNGDRRYIMTVTVMTREVFRAKLMNCHNGFITDFRG